MTRQFNVLLVLIVLGSCAKIPVTVDTSDIENEFRILRESKIYIPDTIMVGVHRIHDSVDVNIRISTFLGSEKRNYYGNEAPGKLKVKWKFDLGSGITKVGSSTRTWSGAGWTGQPLFVEENGHPYLVQGSYDHRLRKIDAESGEEVWSYEFDDVIKGTGSLWYNRKEKASADKLVIFQGSRYGVENDFTQKVIPSYRAISYFTGKEHWRLNSKRTNSYSRDVDASALIYNDTLYIGLENGIFMVLQPDKRYADSVDNIFQPLIIDQELLFDRKDINQHGGNLVTESSPSRIGNRVYVASGSGHIYGYNLDKDSIDWDFFIGSDIDGSAIVTEDSCLLISVEKQYIEGSGGALKLNPRATIENAVEWFKPVEDTVFVSWKGGIIGSIGINDATKPDGFPSLAAFLALDGNLYVVDARERSRTPKGNLKKETGFDGKTLYPVPEEIFRYEIGASISTPIFVKDKLVAAGYNGIYLFKYNQAGEFILLDQFTGGGFEATPIAIDGNIYIASRNGYLYCFGD